MKSDYWEDFLLERFSAGVSSRAVHFMRYFYLSHFSVLSVFSSIPLRSNHISSKRLQFSNFQLAWHFVTKYSTPLAKSLRNVQGTNNELLQDTQPTSLKYLQTLHVGTKPFVSTLTSWNHSSCLIRLHSYSSGYLTTTLPTASSHYRVLQSTTAWSHCSQPLT